MTMPEPRHTFRFEANDLRREFPAFAVMPHGKPLSYLDNAASAQKPESVIRAMADFMASDYANVHRGVHYLSERATLRYEAARATVRRFLNAAHEDEIVLTHGGTEAFNLVASAFAAPRLQPGDEIVLTEMEHHANIVPWHFLRERQGAVLRWARVTEAGALDVAHLASLIGPRTKLVAVSHMSNVLGTVNPVAEIAGLAQAAGAVIVVDGCQSAVHMPVDVQALGCDFFIATGHKLYGPTGIGVLYGKRAHLAAMQPWQGGGEMIREVSADRITYAPPPGRFEAGTPPIVEAVGLDAALRWLMAQDRDAIMAHEDRLRARTEAALKAMNAVRIIGEAEGKGAIVSFEVEGVHAHDLATILDREGVAVRAGHHCAQPLMRRFGVAATARASFALYSTDAEVDALLAGIDKARRLFA